MLKKNAESDMLHILLKRLVLGIGDARFVAQGVPGLERLRTGLGEAQTSNHFVEACRLPASVEARYREVRGLGHHGSLDHHIARRVEEPVRVVLELLMRCSGSMPLICLAPPFVVEVVVRGVVVVVGLREVSVRPSAPLLASMHDVPEGRVLVRVREREGPGCGEDWLPRS